MFSNRRKQTEGNDGYRNPIDSAQHQESQWQFLRWINYFIIREQLHRSYSIHRWFRCYIILLWLISSKFHWWIKRQIEQSFHWFINSSQFFNFTFRFALGKYLTFRKFVDFLLKIYFPTNFRNWVTRMSAWMSFLWKFFL